MKILIITNEFPPQTGGIASFTQNIALHWPNNTQDVFVLASGVRGAKQFDSQCPYRVIRKPIGGVLFFWRLWRLVKKYHIDMVHLHCASSLTGLLVGFINKILKIKYRLWLHSLDFNYLKKGRFKKNKIKKFSLGAWEIVVNSEYLKNQFAILFEDVPKTVTVVYPCPTDLFFDNVEQEQIRHLRSALALEGKKVILTVASLAEGKGFPRLIHMLPSVLAKIPNLVWIVIGDGPKKPAFMDMVQKNHLQNIIRYLGRLPQADLPAYYQLADLFVLLTHPDADAEESWATVFLEASASAIPVLAGRVGGVDEAVQNLKTGLIVDVNQEEMVVKSLVELLKNQDYATQMGVQAKQWVSQNFNWNDQVKKLIHESVN